jgi:hypothetical protein
MLKKYKINFILKKNTNQQKLINLKSHYIKYKKICCIFNKKYKIYFFENILCSVFQNKLIFHYF